LAEVIIHVGRDMRKEKLLEEMARTDEAFERIKHGSGV